MTGDVNQAIKSAMPNSPKLPVSNAQVFVVKSGRSLTVAQHTILKADLKLGLKQVVI